MSSAMTKYCTALRLAIVEVATLVVVITSIGECKAAETECRFPREVLDIRRPLPRMLWRLETNAPIKIVALGSSSTAGAGATKPETAYPIQLQAHLSSLLPGHPILVVNRGRNGDRLSDMLSRLSTDVLPEFPDVVIWQLGTNALLADLNPNAVGLLLLRGMREMTAMGADLIVMDPQFAPKVLALTHDEARRIASNIAKLPELLTRKGEQ